MTHVFGRDFGLGNEKWHKSEKTGRMEGNPSVSILLASYMVSLRNRKVHIFFHVVFTASEDLICGY